MTEIPYLAQNDIDRDISLDRNDIDRDLSLDENDIDKDISLAENDIDRQGQQQDKTKTTSNMFWLTKSLSASAETPSLWLKIILTEISLRLKMILTERVNSRLRTSWKFFTQPFSASAVQCIVKRTVECRVQCGVQCIVQCAVQCTVQCSL